MVETVVIFEDMRPATATYGGRSPIKVRPCHILNRGRNFSKSNGFNSLSQEHGGLGKSQKELFKYSQDNTLNPDGSVAFASAWNDRHHVTASKFNG